MTDELKQLLEPEFMYAGEKYVRVETAEQYGREVQCQTVEAAAEIAEGGAPLSPINNRERGQRHTAKSIAERIRALLSPAQEVRNG